ncbi:Uma2 family endonuclease [bacterium]|nr:Uma2 family endonuclease [bacterium]
MTLSLRQDRDKVWTYQDYLTLPEDGNRYEIIDGVLYGSPSPLSIHQLLSKRLGNFLYQFELEGQGFVYHAPLDVHIPGCTPVQPDLIFLTREQRGLIQDRGIFGAPHLLVEILSPGTRSLDRVKKLNKYAAAGVPNYVMVEPEASVLEWLQLDRNGYRLAHSLGEGDSWIFQGKSLRLSDLFAELPDT